MKLFCFLLGFAFLFSVVFSAKVATPFSRITTFGKSHARTIDNCAKVDLKTGEQTVVSTNFVFYEASITVDGISTIDPKNTVFYYVTDSTADLNIYSVNVTTGSLQAPIALYTASIDGLVFDLPRGNLLVSGYYKTREDTYDLALIVYGTDQGPVHRNLLTGLRFGPQAYDSKTELLYNYWVDNKTEIVTEINLADTSSPVLKNVTVECVKDDVYVIRLYPTPSANKLWAIAEGMNNTLARKKLDVRTYHKTGRATAPGAVLVSYVMELDLVTGKCTKQTLLPSKGGIITAYSMYDNVIYYGESTNGGVYLHTYDVDTKAHSEVKSSYTFEDLQVIGT